MFKAVIKTLSTFFFVGYLPLIPGTFGSLAALLLYYPIRNNSLYVLLAFLIVTAVGFLVCGRTEKLLQKKDPSYVVIDEVSGMFLSLLFLPYDLRIVIMGFFLFRLLDTLKPFPVSRLERLNGSLGIMSDDLLAGLYTNIVLQVLIRCTSFKVS
jgi:phosphatidylglycerophosphatase A